MLSQLGGASLRSLNVKSLNHIRQEPALQRVAEAIDDLLKGHSNVANQLSTDPNGGDVVPPNVASLHVQHLGGGHVDIAITDNAKITRAIEYHLEYTTEKSWTNPRGRTLGSWRTAEFTLPNGVWNFRAYSQFPAGGPPSTPVYCQGTVTVTDGNAIPLMPSQGSGTGLPKTGGGAGAGKTITR